MSDGASQIPRTPQASDLREEVGGCSAAGCKADLRGGVRAGRSRTVRLRVVLRGSPLGSTRRRQAIASLGTNYTGRRIVPPVCANDAGTRRKLSSMASAGDVCGMGLFFPSFLFPLRSPWCAIIPCWDRPGGGQRGACDEPARAGCGQETDCIYVHIFAMTCLVA